MLSFLRDETSDLHQRVDDAFARFSLSDPDSYGRMLTAHARALPAAEAVLAARSDLPAWRARTSMLAEDLATLDLPMPWPLPFAPAAGIADALGILYVTEGSRLGGVMLSRQVAPGLPKSYLAAAHLPGEWRRLISWIDEAINVAGEAARTEAVAGATRTFGLYEAAAR